MECNSSTNGIVADGEIFLKSQIADCVGETGTEVRVTRATLSDLHIVLFTHCTF
jgi:hypothetical protein